MKMDSTTMAITHPTGRRYRMVGLWLGICYLLLPTVVFNLHFLSASLYNALFTILWVCIMLVGILSVGFLGASLWRPAHRDWPSVDRAFGIFLLIVAAILVLGRLLYQPSSIPAFTETTQRLLLVRGIVAFSLILSSAVLFFKRPTWAFVPLGVLVFLLLLFQFFPTEPDHPDFLKQREQSASKAPFHNAVDDAFWNEYWATKDPEAVAALFASLPQEAQSALSGFMEEDAIRALLENGDDKVFLEAIYNRAHRGEDGAFVTLSAVTTVASPKVFIVGGSGRYLYFIALAYALTRSRMGMRSSNATA